MSKSERPYRIPESYRTERVRLFWSYNNARTRRELGLMTREQWDFFEERWRRGNGMEFSNEPPRGTIRDRDAWGRLAYGGRQTRDPES